MDPLIQQIDALAGVGASGRLSGGVDLYVFRTAEGAVCRCHARIPAGVAAAVEAVAAEPRGRPREWALEYGRYLGILAEVGPVMAVRAGPLYRFGAPPPAPPNVAAITPANAHLLGEGLDEWLPDVAEGLPMWAALEGGRAVSLCASVAIAGGAHAAGVETLSLFRGRGFAAGCVAGWAGAVLE
ncbi:MAG: hypothetical protein ACREEQ_02575, partial [Caulobacteraceae bacterium]